MKHSEKNSSTRRHDVRENAYAPFSNFKVGAALETDDGDIYHRQQCRIGELRPDRLRRTRRDLERISQAKRRFVKIAVVVDTEELTPPCGVCRQIIWEFGGDVPVILRQPPRQKRDRADERPAATSFRYEIFEIEIIFPDFQTSVPVE